MSSESPTVHADLPTSRVAQVVSSPSSVEPVYQPIVDLGDRSVVGYEALSRWPAAGPVDPVAVFDHARERGELGAVEWACRLAAIQGAVDAGLGAGHTVFVNVESDALDPVRMPPPPQAGAVFAAAAAAGFHLVIELTERTLLTDPAAVLATAASAREHGHAIALDDVGVNDETLALLPLIAPDIVKLDRSLIHNAPNRRTASILSALAAHTERTDTIVLAEGIETCAHLDTALGWGASLGQGRLFGSPAALPASATRGSTPLTFARQPCSVPVVPSDLLDQLDVRIADYQLLRVLSRYLEDHALTLDEPVSILSTFQTAARFTPVVAERYSTLASRHPFVAALAVGLGTEPAPGVRGSAIAPDSPLAREWTLAVVGHHYAVALIAREVASSREDRRFEYALTHNRTHTVRAARALVHCVTAHNV